MHNSSNIFKNQKILLSAALIIILGIAFYALAISPWKIQRAAGECVLKARRQYKEKWMTTCQSLFDQEIIKQYDPGELCGSKTTSGPTACGNPH